MRLGAGTKGGCSPPVFLGIPQIDATERSPRLPPLLQETEEFYCTARGVLLERRLLNTIYAIAGRIDYLSASIRFVLGTCSEREFEAGYPCFSSCSRIPR